MVGEAQRIGHGRTDPLERLDSCKGSEKCDVSICNIGCTGFCNDKGEETVAVGREVSALARDLACSFPGTTA